MEHLTHSFFSSIVAGKALLYFCRGSGKKGCYSLLIPRHEMNFCKCFNDPRTRARISQDKLVPGGDSDKAQFKIKGQKLCVPHSGGRPGDAAVTMGTGELVLTTGASFFFYPPVSPAVAGGFGSGAGRSGLDVCSVAAGGGSAALQLLLWLQQK